MRLLRRTLALAALTLAVAPAAAIACTQPASTQPFAAFGDANGYWLAPGGGFETGTAPWALSGAAITGGNETFFAGAQSDSSSLAIPPGGVAVSPAFCVDPTNNTMRLFLKKGGSGTLAVDLLYTNADGRYSERRAATLAPGGNNWAPTAVLDLANAIPSGQVSKGDLSLRVRFTASPDPGTWSVDDVYIDPFRFD